ncbi:MAG: DivIVA domain-containing protein [Actinobacteria bacterium]|nr:DivIVA domain-containing protein [Actinomycetota bacterium]
MALTPIDIHNKEFKSARLGGYNEEDVDSFLDLIADELEKMTLENEKMAEELDTARKKLAEFEEMQSSLQSALITASKSAEDVKEQSNREAGQLLENSRKEAEAIIRAAQEESGRIITLARTEGQRIEKKFEKIRAAKSKYLDSMRKVAEAQLKELKELEEQDRQFNMIENAVVSEGNAAVNEASAGTDPVQHTELTATPDVVTAQERLPETLKTEENVSGFHTVSNPAEPQGAIATDVNTPDQVNAVAAVAPDTTAQGPEVVQGRMKENATPVVVEEMQMTAEVSVGTQATRQSEETVTQIEDNHGRVATRTEDLVEEILGMNPGDDPYAEFDDIGDEDVKNGKRKLGRKEKKNKFWE